MKNTVVHSHYRKLFFMSEGLLSSSGNFSIGANLANTHSLTSIQNINIPYNTLTPLSIVVPSTSKYIVIEFRAYQSGSSITYSSGNPSGYISNIIIPYGSDATTGLSVQTSSNMMTIGIKATWSSNTLNLYHTYSSSSVTVYALLGIFE